jgi:hypothetical protein
MALTWVGVPGLEPGTSSLSGKRVIRSDFRILANELQRVIRTRPQMSVGVATGRYSVGYSPPDSRSEAPGLNLLIRRCGQIVHSRLPVVVTSGSIPYPSSRGGRCPHSWQQYWQHWAGARSLPYQVSFASGLTCVKVGMPAVLSVSDRRSPRSTTSSGTWRARADNIVTRTS